MALIFLGCTSVVFITGTLVQLLTEAQIQEAHSEANAWKTKSRNSRTTPSSAASAGSVE